MLEVRENEDLDILNSLERIDELSQECEKRVMKILKLINELINSEKIFDEVKHE